MATLNIKNFPDSLYNILQLKAKQNRRSLAQEVIYLLQEAIEEKEKYSILQLKGLGKKSWKGVNVKDHINKERDY